MSKLTIASFDKGEAPASCRLRTDLTHEERDEGRVIFFDPLTLRQFVFDEAQAAVLLMADGEHSSREIAEEVFGDEGAADGVETLFESVRALGLLSSAQSYDAYALRVQQAGALRVRAARARDKRAAESVRWAKEQLPFYREHLGDEALTTGGVADMSALPMTTKNDVRTHFPAGFVPTGVVLQDLVEAGKVELVTTSGSTGGRLQYIYDTQQKVPATLAFKPGFGDEKRIVFTTPICSGQVCHRGGVPFEERLFGDTRLVLNSTERVLRLERSQLDEMVADIDRHGASEFTVDPVYAAAMVRAFQRFDMPLPKVERITSGFEYLTVRHRNILEEAFGIEVHNAFGATDLGGPAAVSCENNRMHVLNHVVFEFVKNGQPVEYGEVGEIVVTTISNPYSRLIRYRVGDLGRPIESCGCAWDDWQCYEIEGKIKDTLLATDGTRRTSRAVDDLFAGLSWVDFYLLTQKGENDYRLQAVRWDGEGGVDDEKVFKERFSELFGTTSQLRIQYVRELPIEQSFKFPQTKQKFTEPLSEW